MFKFNSMLLFSENPRELSEFYKKMFITDPLWEEGGYSGFVLGPGMLIIGPHDKVHGKNQHPERMIFNLETKDVEKEFKRMKKLGAKVIKEPYHPGEAEDMLIATLADPDGNYFQLATPMEEETSSQAN
jgi:predicted enzyme related to lactoylglutathione lyase